MKKIIFSLVFLTCFSSALFSQLNGFDEYGKQNGVHIWTHRDNRTGELTVKFKNNSDVKKRGTITVFWYESDGTQCGKSADQEFTAGPGVSGGYMEGYFYNPYACKCSKLGGAYSCKFKIVLSD